MQLHHYGFIVSVLILAFALTHLGVSVGILVLDIPYRDLYRPEIGLASFNVAISFFGIVVSIGSLIYFATHKKAIGKFLLTLKRYLIRLY